MFQIVFNRIYFESASFYYPSAITWHLCVNACDFVFNYRTLIFCTTKSESEQAAIDDINDY